MIASKKLFGVVLDKLVELQIVGLGMESGAGERVPVDARMNCNNWLLYPRVPEQFKCLIFNKLWK